jgi:energy-coupling factor transporter ATP-binding protein EcfA2
MNRDPRYAEPFFWWGQAWAASPQRDLADLLRDGTIDPATAAILWAALSRLKSLVVIAGPAGAGKSTLLAALLELLPAGTRRVYLHGCFEAFGFLSDPEIDPRHTALLVNEISPHLPIYLWGPALHHLLAAAERGYAVLATAHAATVPEFVASLSGSPLRIPTPRIAAFDYVAILEESPLTTSGRRVSGVWRLQPRRDGVEIALAPVLHNISQDSPFESDRSITTWFPTPELQVRERILAALRDRTIDRLPAAVLLAADGEGTSSP